MKQTGKETAKVGLRGSEQEVPAAAVPLVDAADPLVAQLVAAIGRERLEALATSVWSYRIRARKP